MDCEYTDPDDILIDSIIDGVHVKKLQDRLLDRGKELTLAKAIEIGQQYEMSQKQVRVVRDEDAPISTVPGSEETETSKQSTYPQIQSEETWFATREELPQVWQRPSARLESRDGIHMLLL